MGLVAVQVRKDLQLTGAVGRPKTGYRLKELLEALEETLGYNNKTEMFFGRRGEAWAGRCCTTRGSGTTTSASPPPLT